ncbi:MAG: hypothetical protein ACJAYG_001425 [Oceanicoccus sp.]|jgi:hypothetical protein
MKNVAIFAIILGIIGSAANAESAVSEASITLAMNSNAAVTWSVPAMASNNNALATKIERATAKTMEQVSIALDKRLEAKISRELEYAMQ